MTVLRYQTIMQIPAPYVTKLHTMLSLKT